MSCNNDKDHCCNHSDSTVAQTLDEMEFERGIWYAAQYGDLVRVQTLLDRPRAIVDQRAAGGYTALHFAARFGHLEVCKYLVEKGADINAITRSGWTTPLHKACSAGHYVVVEYLLSKKADPAMVDADGKTALHKAIESKNELICKLIEEKASFLTDLPDNRGRKPCDLKNF